METSLQRACEVLRGLKSVERSRTYTHTPSLGMAVVVENVFGELSILLLQTRSAAGTDLILLFFMCNNLQGSDGFALIHRLLGESRSLSGRFAAIIERSLFPSSRTRLAVCIHIFFIFHEVFVHGSFVLHSILT